MASVYAKIDRVRDWCAWFSANYPQVCWVCGEKIDTTAFLVGDSQDGIVLHHVNGNREDAEMKNLRFCHRSCHRSFHRQLEEHDRDIRDPKAKQIHGETPKCKSSKKRVSGNYRKPR